MVEKISLLECVFDDGLFPAAVGSGNWLMNEWKWIRDNYYNWLAVDGEVKWGIVKGFKGIVDYNKSLGKFDNMPLAEHEFVNPVYLSGVKEIRDKEHPDRGWAFIQTDCYGNLLEVMSAIGDKDRADLMVKYLGDISYWERKGYGFWEWEIGRAHV